MRILLAAPIAFLALTVAGDEAAAADTVITDTDTGEVIDTVDFALSPSLFFGRNVRVEPIVVRSMNTSHARAHLIADGARIDDVFAIIPETDLDMKRWLFANCNEDEPQERCAGTFEGRWDAAGYIWDAQFTPETPIAP